MSEDLVKNHRPTKNLKHQPLLDRRRAVSTGLVPIGHCKWPSARCLNTLPTYCGTIRITLTATRIACKNDWPLNKTSFQRTPHVKPVCNSC